MRFAVCRLGYKSKILNELCSMQVWLRYKNNIKGDAVCRLGNKK